MKSLFLTPQKGGFKLVAGDDFLENACHRHKAERSESAAT